MRLARIATFGAAALTTTLLLTGCTGESGPAVTVIATGPALTPSPTPVVTPEDTPTPADHFYTLDETWDLAAADEAQGSGCAPGIGQLPSGVWFGIVSSWSAASINIDLACWWTGTEAEAQAAARGEEAYDYYITNDATTVRNVTFAADAIALKADVLLISDTTSWAIFSVADVIADPGGSMPVDETHPLVWIAVNGGVVTGVAVQYVP